MTSTNVILKFISILFLVILICPNIQGQDHLQLISQGERDYSKIREAFFQYWERTGRRSSDLKKFNRWRDIMRPRLQNGLLPTSNLLAKRVSEFKLIQNNKNQFRVVSEPEEVWEAMGPIDWQVDENGYNPGNGRINCITVDPNDPNKIFIGAASGGVWISDDGGSNWRPTTDDLAVLGITDIYINPSNSSEILALTGDAYASSTPSIGIIKSTDGGNTWNQTNFTGNGIFETYFKLEVNPANPNIMLVAGNGIHFSSTAGAQWTIPVPIHESISDLVFHPTDPSIVYAVTRFQLNDNELTVYKSTDSGASWVSTTFTFESLERRIMRKALSVSPDNPDAVYILATAADGTFGGVFKSSDQLETLELQSDSPNILGYSTQGRDSDGQGWYDLTILADPNDEEVVYIGGVHIWKSTNSGVNWTLQNNWNWGNQNYPYVHADIHTIDTYHDDLYIGCDGGIWKSQDDGTTFTDLSLGLNIGQFYRFGLHPTDENMVIGGLQDNGSFIRKNDQWFHIFGADGMEALFDYDDPSVVYSEYQNGGIIRYSNFGTTIDRFVINPEGGFASWVTPYIMHPEENHTLYFGYQNVWKSTDQGNNMTALSDFQDEDGPITILKQHSLNPNNMLCGKDGGTLYLTTDEGATWNVISDDLPRDRLILTDAAFDYSDPNVIWATFSNYESNEKVFRSEDGGQNWADFSLGLPEVPVNCILSINSCVGKMYAGTDIGVYSKSKSEYTWTYLGEGLPNVIVRELEMHDASGKLFAATFGRGIWKIPIEQGGDQFITFDPIESKTFGDGTFILDASTDSNLEVEYVSSNTDVLSIEGDVATILGAGSVTITALQTGNCEYNPAESIEQILIIDKSDQEITFEEIDQINLSEESFELVGSASSGLELSYSSSDENVVSIDGTRASFQMAGEATITASQQGNENYNAAADVEQKLVVFILGLGGSKVDMKLYPNPVLNSNRIYIESAEHFGEANISIVDINGKVVYQSKSFLKAGENEIYVGKIKAGVYILKLNEHSFEFIRR